MPPTPSAPNWHVWLLAQSGPSDSTTSAIFLPPHVAVLRVLKQDEAIPLVSIVASAGGQPEQRPLLVVQCCDETLSIRSSLLDVNVVGARQRARQAEDRDKRPPRWRALPVSPSRASAHTPSVDESMGWIAVSPNPGAHAAMLATPAQSSSTLYFVSPGLLSPTSILCF